MSREARTGSPQWGMYRRGHVLDVHPQARGPEVLCGLLLRELEDVQQDPLLVEYHAAARGVSALILQEVCVVMAYREVHLVRDAMWLMLFDYQRHHARVTD